MNPLTNPITLITFSSTSIIKYTTITLLSIILLPLITLLIITNAGIPQVSQQLVQTNQTTHTIVIRDPTGKVIAQLTAQTVWPIHGVITLGFGQPDPPYQPIHTGIDIAAPIETPITPFMQGRVIEVSHINWGYGNYVVIDHGNNVTSLYGHMDKTNATVGQLVKPGDVIGYVGQTGWATGPHVHFQIDVFGIPVNPQSFVQGTP